MENLKLDKIDKRLIRIMDKLPPEILKTMLRMAEEEQSRLENQQTGISQAVIHASFEDVCRGSKIMEGISFAGVSMYDKYKDCLFAIVGLAYTAGIAEGKQQERNRRRHATIRKQIRATGKLPTE